VGDVEHTGGRSSGPPSAAARNTVIALLVAFQISSWAGDLLLSFLIPDHAIVLLAMNDRLRNYALASPYLDALQFYAVSIVRLVAPYPCFFLLGRWYGDGAVRWMEGRTPRIGSVVRTAERWFAKAPYPLVAFIPINLLCVFAGASEMSLAGFVVAKVLGGLVLLFLARQASELLFTPLTAIGDWITDHRLLVVLVTAAIILLSIRVQRSSQGGTEIDHLIHLEEEIEAEEIEAEGIDDRDLTADELGQSGHADPLEPGSF
jgi:membrane protein DedA with SNARE-associated domain